MHSGRPSLQQPLRWKRSSWCQMKGQPEGQQLPRLRAGRGRQVRLQEAGALAKRQRGQKRQRQRQRRRRRRRRRQWCQRWQILAQHQSRPLLLYQWLHWTRRQWW